MAKGTPLSFLPYSTLPPPFLHPHSLLSAPFIFPRLPHSSLHLLPHPPPFFLSFYFQHYPFHIVFPLFFHAPFTSFPSTPSPHSPHRPSLFSHHHFLLHSLSALSLHPYFPPRSFPSFTLFYLPHTSTSLTPPLLFPLLLSPCPHSLQLRPHFTLVLLFPMILPLFQTSFTSSLRSNTALLPPCPFPHSFPSGTLPQLTPPLLSTLSFALPSPLPALNLTYSYVHSHTHSATGIITADCMRGKKKS